MPEPSEILNIAFARASSNITKPIVEDPEVQNRIEVICRNIKNRACVRLLLAALLAKLHKPEVDIRKPYTEIGDPDTYSGRYYDESFITDFINKHHLPCNPTTAFLTPALRNRNTILTPDLDLEGRPKDLYTKTLQLLTDVHEGRVSPEDLLAETIRCLLNFRNERDQRIESLRQELKDLSREDTIPLSAEDIVTLMKQHLDCPGSSRLPVLMVAAAYQAAEQYLGERTLPLHGHTAADRQTGALGDLEITLRDDDNVIRTYEMKTRRLQKSDIDQAVQKVNQSGQKIDSYIFITTESIDPEIQDYAKSLYETIGGIEFVILDCISFVRHFLHLFHRLRIKYLDCYQELVLAEPDSSVSQPLKEAFLVLRKAAESH